MAGVLVFENDIPFWDLDVLSFFLTIPHYCELVYAVKYKAFTKPLLVWLQQGVIIVLLIAIRYLKIDINGAGHTNYTQSYKIKNVLLRRYFKRECTPISLNQP